jgi:hypothetical protein
MITNQSRTTRSKPGSGHEPANRQRRRLIGGAIGGAMVALLPFSGRVMAQETAAPGDPFILLLKGIYEPVVDAPDIGLSAVDLNDGSYTTTKIYPAFGITGSTNNDNQGDNAVGNIYVRAGAMTQNGGKLCAYQIPGGALAMRFTDGGFSTIPHPDGQGGQFMEGTFELKILEATGIYRAFQGGHNHMVDKLQKLADGTFDELCFCVISQYQFP